MSQQFFYDGQLRRYLVQFIRAVSNFEVEFGKDRDGIRTLQRVPVYYGDPSRQAATILKGNSENTLNSVPAMSAYITGFNYDQTRLQDPSFISKINIRKRNYDPDTGTYGNQQGDSYTIERLMPVPYKLTVKLDIWTSNTEQKMQLIEQIATLFNPALEIQSTDNYIDWTSLTYVQLNETLWTSRVIPAGADESIDVATMTFEIPCWITSPAKVKQLGVIQRIVKNIYNEQGEFDESSIFVNYEGRRVFSPVDYGIFYVGNQLHLVKQNEVVVDDVLTKLNPPETWRSVIELYGTLQIGNTQIRLELPTGNELIGYITYHPTDPKILLFEPDIDTQPANTLEAVNAVINPINVKVDAALLTPTTGTRYLITDDVGDESNVYGSTVWGTLVAKANDIIEYNGTKWIVVFDAANNQDTEYLLNTNTNIQYRYDGTEWVKSVEGLYRGGEWSIVI